MSLSFFFTRSRKINVERKWLLQVHLQTKLTCLHIHISFHFCTVYEEITSQCRSNVSDGGQNPQNWSKNTLKANMILEESELDTLNYSLLSGDGFQVGTSRYILIYLHWEVRPRISHSLHVNSDQQDWTFEEDQSTLKYLSVMHGQVSVSETHTLTAVTLERAVIWDRKGLR